MAHKAPPIVSPPITDPYEICTIDEIELIDDIPGSGFQDFRRKTQLRITGKKPGSYYVYVTVNNPEPSIDPEFDRDLLLVPEPGEFNVDAGS